MGEGGAVHGEVFEAAALEWVVKGVGGVAVAGRHGGLGWFGGREEEMSLVWYVGGVGLWVLVCGR